MKVSPIILRLSLLSLILAAISTDVLAQGVVNFRPGAASSAFSATLSSSPQIGPITLTNSPPPSPNSDCITPPAGLVSWWPAENNANDIIGGNNGMLMDGASFTNGEVGRAFLFATTNAGVKVPASAALDVGLGDGLTIEGWINPSTLATRGYIAEWNDGNTNEYTPYGVQLQILRPDEFSLGAGNLFADVHGVDGSPHWIMAPGGTISADTFQHVALTYDKTSGVATLYCNGEIVAQQNMGSFATLTSYDFYIGHRPGLPSIDAAGSFSGSIDELAVYNRALSPTEIQSLYIAGSAGKCPETTPTNALSNLIDVDFGGGGIRPSAKTGPAAIGQNNSDFWNFYTRDDTNGNWLTFGSLPNLKLVDGTETGVGLTVANAPGDWGNGSTDPMFNDYIYPFDGGDVTITVTNLPAGNYDIYAYSSDSKYEINSDGFTSGMLSTFESTVSNPPVWIEGKSYALFKNVPVRANQPLVLSALPLNDVANISGMQIVSSSATNTLSTGSPPSIVTQPTNQIVPQGGQVTFFATAEGTAPLSYKWSFNGTKIVGATNASLTLTNLHPQQAGSYSIKITSPYGSVTSASAMLTVTAQNVLVYNYSGNEKVTTAKQEFSYNYSGEMFFIPASTNGVFIGWATISGKKQYWVSAFSDYLVATIPGDANHTYTVIGKAGNNVDSNGLPHIWSYLHKGQNATLSIGSKKTFAFPDTFACSDSQIYPDPQSGIMILREAASTSTYLSSTTQAANNNGQTLADLVNTLTQNLARQGYKPQ